MTIAVFRLRIETSCSTLVWLRAMGSSSSLAGWYGTDDCKREKYLEKNSLMSNGALFTCEH